jgi:hypothetical protein
LFVFFRGFEGLSLICFEEERKRGREEERKGGWRGRGEDCVRRESVPWEGGGTNTRTHAHTHKKGTQHKAYK